MEKEERVAQALQEGTPVLPDTGIPTPDATHDEVVYSEEEFLSDAAYITQVGQEIGLDELVQAVDDLLHFRGAGYSDEACRPYMNGVVGHAPTGSAQADEVERRIIRMEEWIAPCEEEEGGCGWWGCDLDQDTHEGEE